MNNHTLASRQITSIIDDDDDDNDNYNYYFYVRSCQPLTMVDKPERTSQA
jgi:hypothetical protein